MGYTDNLSPEVKQRIVQELVPGKQISLAHINANPDKILYTKLGLDPAIEYSRSAIGILTISPAELSLIHILTSTAMPLTPAIRLRAVTTGTVRIPEVQAITPQAQVLL